MSQSGRTDDGQSNKDNNKENQESNSDNNNNEDEMLAAAASSTSPEEQGDDGTTGTGDLLLPRRIFCPSNISTPSSMCMAPRIDLTLEVDRLLMLIYTT